MNDETKAGLIIFSILVPIIVLLFVIGYFEDQKLGKMTDPVITIARLDYFTLWGEKPVERGVYRYYVNDEEYTLEGYFNKTLMPGDKFQLKYSQKDPSKSKVISFAPVFTDNEVVLKTIGTIKNIGAILGHYVKFEFTVDGIKYLRVQDINPTLSLRGIDLGSQFVVHYWRDNPQRGIINLNQPIIK